MAIFSDLPEELRAEILLLAYRQCRHIRAFHLRDPPPPPPHSIANRAITNPTIDSSTTARQVMDNTSLANLSGLAKAKPRKVPHHYHHQDQHVYTPPRTALFLIFKDCIRYLRREFYSCITLHIYSPALFKLGRTMKENPSLGQYVQEFNLGLDWIDNNPALSLSSRNRGSGMNNNWRNDHILSPTPSPILPPAPGELGYTGSSSDLDSYVLEASTSPSPSPELLVRVKESTLFSDAKEKVPTSKVAHGDSSETVPETSTPDTPLTASDDMKSLKPGELSKLDSLCSIFRVISPRILQLKTSNCPSSALHLLDTSRLQTLIIQYPPKSPGTLLRSQPSQQFNNWIGLFSRLDSPFLEHLHISGLHYLDYVNSKNPGPTIPNLPKLRFLFLDTVHLPASPPILITCFLSSSIAATLTHLDTGRARHISAPLISLLAKTTPNLSHLAVWIDPNPARSHILSKLSDAVPKLSHLRCRNVRDSTVDMFLSHLFPERPSTLITITAVVVGGVKKLLFPNLVHIELDYGRNSDSSGDLRMLEEKASSKRRIKVQTVLNCPSWNIDRINKNTRNSHSASLGEIDEFRKGRGEDCDAIKKLDQEQNPSIRRYNNDYSETDTDTDWLDNPLDIATTLPFLQPVPTHQHQHQHQHQPHDAGNPI